MIYRSVRVPPETPAATDETPIRFTEPAERNDRVSRVIVSEMRRRTMFPSSPFPVYMFILLRRVKYVHTQRAVFKYVHRAKRQRYRRRD